MSTSAHTGGAARAALRLQTTLTGAGIDSEMIVADGDSSQNGVHSAGSDHHIRQGLLYAIETRLHNLQRSDNPVLHSVAVVPGPALSLILNSPADVINLHWVARGLLSIEQIGHVLRDRAVVWTLHDMWPFCGSEHYSPPTNDPRFVTGYDRTNRPSSARGLDLDRWCWQRKRRSWVEPAHLVAPSNWMADTTRQSRLMATWPVTVIPNPVDLDAFRPIDRSVARQQLGLPKDPPLVLFAADGGSANPIKGFDLLAAAMARIVEAIPDVQVVIVGNRAGNEHRRSLVPIHDLGYLDDEAELILAYGAVDCVAVPSIMDNLPQVAVEAQACGRPVVAFRTGGLSDIVEHGVTGVLAEPFSTGALAAALITVLGDARLAATLGSNARQRAETLWSGPTIVDRYLDVYRQAVASRATVSHPPGRR